MRRLCAFAHRYATYIPLFLGCCSLAGQLTSVHGLFYEDEVGEDNRVVISRASLTMKFTVKLARPTFS